VPEEGSATNGCPSLEDLVTDEACAESLSIERAPAVGVGPLG
jgi:hypothetical protein